MNNNPYIRFLFLCFLSSFIYLRNTRLAENPGSSSSGKLQFGRKNAEKDKSNYLLYGVITDFLRTVTRLITTIIGWMKQAQLSR